MNLTNESMEPYRQSEEQTPDSPSPSVDPNAQVCPKFDATGIAMFPVGDPKKMGFRVVDNITEEHIQ